jgi:hypothetical protein
MTLEKVKIEVVKGVEGCCLCICDKEGSGQRISGPKPWGGGQTIHSFEVDIEELIKTIKQNSYGE